MNERTQRLLELDHAHVWHPFTPMKQWVNQQVPIIDRAEGEYLFDTEGNRYIDGVSSLWCNVHGHRVPEIDQAIRDQLDKVAHSTLLGLGSPPSIELAAMLAERAPGALNKVFYSDAGATAVEIAFKVAVGYWYHRGRPEKSAFIGFGGAYHGDTVGAMSVGYSDLFHRPFVSMVFRTHWAPSPDPARPPQPVVDRLKMEDADGQAKCPACGPEADCTQAVFPSQCPRLARALRDHCLDELEAMLQTHADHTAAIVIEPVMQGAAGMVCQPEGFVRGVGELARKYDVLLITDEVATGFGRTGPLFACEREVDESWHGPDIMALAKGISGGYLPLAATMFTDEVEGAFRGELRERKTFYHGHTYTGNALACAAAIASLELFDRNRVLDRVAANAAMIADHLEALKACPHVLDVRQRGIMVGIEICRDRDTREPFDFAKQVGARLCAAMRPHGLIVRPLGNVIILMPMPAMSPETLRRMLDIVVETINGWKYEHLEG